MPNSPTSPTYRAPRLFVEGALSAGAQLELPPEQARYLLTVMRRTSGAPIIAFNGQDGEWLTRLEPQGRKGAVLMPERLLRQQPTGAQNAAEPWLVFATVKRQATELIVEKATELGCARFVPVRAKRSNTERVNQARLERIAIEAAEQSERLTVPTFATLQSLDALLTNWSADRILIVGDETGGAPPAAETLFARASGASISPFAFLVGPEGGFASDELDAMRQLDFVVCIGLGPRVLRAETAAIVGLALAQAALGDFQTGRSASG